mgnify:CR=1 FL=1
MPPDTTSTEFLGGGRTIPCTRGVYWRDQGKSPCEDLGTIKFRTPDGTEISNIGEIARGYKSGYNIMGRVQVAAVLVLRADKEDKMEIIQQEVEDQDTLMDL